MSNSMAAWPINGRGVFSPWHMFRTLCFIVISPLPPIKKSCSISSRLLIDEFVSHTYSTATRLLCENSMASSTSRDFLYRNDRVWYIMIKIATKLIVNCKTSNTIAWSKYKLEILLKDVIGERPNDKSI
jgi:hypothetical protein